MRAHFIDLDVILSNNAKVWIVDKTRPSIPIFKITRPEYNLIKNGIYRSHNNSIYFGGDKYWITTDMINSLKVKCKNSKVDISNLAFSMQEFTNKDIIENIEYKINLDNILHLKNINDDIYVICSKNNKENYEVMISKIEDGLRENDLNIKKFYFISETFYNRSEDEVSHRKVRLLLQHLIGLKTDNDKFTDEELIKYDEVNYYDDENSAISLAIDSNRVFEFILSNTDDSIKDRIKQDLKLDDRYIVVHKYTGNMANRYITRRVKIEYANLIKKFENFKILNEDIDLYSAIATISLGSYWIFRLIGKYYLNKLNKKGIESTYSNWQIQEIDGVINLLGYSTISSPKLIFTIDVKNRKLKYYNDINPYEVRLNKKELDEILDGVEFVKNLNETIGDYLYSFKHLGFLVDVRYIDFIKKSFIVNIHKDENLSYFNICDILDELDEFIYRISQIMKVSVNPDFELSSIYDNSACVQKYTTDNIQIRYLNGQVIDSSKDLSCWTSTKKLNTVKSIRNLFISFI